MKHITTIGLDIAKQVFQIHGADAEGSPISNRKLGEPRERAADQEPWRDDSPGGGKSSTCSRRRSTPGTAWPRRWRSRQGGARMRFVQRDPDPPHERARAPGDAHGNLFPDLKPGLA